MMGWQERRDADREERRRYENDVFYEVWRSGGNPDRINDDRVDTARYNGESAESAARRELAAQRPREREPEQEEQQDYEIGPQPPDHPVPDPDDDLPF